MRTHLMLVVAAALSCALMTHAQEPPPAAPAQPAPTVPAATAEGYVWAQSCQACHAEIYDAWSKTKHARAIDRLGRGERQAGSQCVGCHITGAANPIEVGGEILNANVQCESCHGAGKAHVEAAQAGNPAAARLVAAPPERVCVACHNDKSPHYRGFYYSAFKGLVHKK